MTTGMFVDGCLLLGATLRPPGPVREPWAGGGRADRPRAAAPAASKP